MERFSDMGRYAQFHMTYLGFDFLEVLTGKLYTKGIFWDKFREVAEELPIGETPSVVPHKFILKKRPKLNEPN